MKIAIIGSRGIPNRYGGFEQFAEILSTELVKRGHQVTVYSPHFHPYQEETFEGVDIKHVYSPEKRLGAFANFIYDYLSLRHACRQKHDILLELGYQSSAFSFKLVRLRGGKIVTNLDGLEWKRDKWSSKVKKMTKFFERYAVKHSHALVSDNEGIQKYIKDEYGADSDYIAYSTKVFSTFDAKVLSDYNLKESGYYLLIARLEPENNVEIIIKGYLESKAPEPLVVIGNINTPFAEKWKEEYGGDRVRFLGGIYNQDHLYSLRYYTKGYFHGHSVGGTNPSLLEAMGSKALIICHDNDFNKAVLTEGHAAFAEEKDVARIVDNIDELLVKKDQLVQQNLEKIDREYSEDIIVTKYEELFKRVLAEPKGQ